jgi:hypothetical protein
MTRLTRETRVAGIAFLVRASSPTSVGPRPRGAWLGPYPPRPLSGSSPLGQIRSGPSVSPAKYANVRWLDEGLAYLASDAASGWPGLGAGSRCCSSTSRRHSMTEASGR